MTPLATILWLCNIFFDTIGQLSFKAAAVAEDSLDGMERWRAMLKDKWIWLGVGCYIVEFFLWLAFLSMVPLSLGMLVGSVNIIAVMVGGRILFGEEFTRRRIAATIMIACGVSLVGWA